MQHQSQRQQHQYLYRGTQQAGHAVKNRISRLRGLLGKRLNVAAMKTMAAGLMAISGIFLYVAQHE